MLDGYDGKKPSSLLHQSKLLNMAYLEEPSDVDLTGPETYDTVPQHPKFFSYTPKPEQPQEFMYHILMRTTEAARRDEARQQWHANHVFRRFRAAEKDDERRAAIAELNPDIDREPARRGVVLMSKLTITLFMPEETGHVLREFRYQVPVDWSSKSAIADLNHWRGGVFGKHLPLRHKTIPRYHEEEDQWLKDNVIGTKVVHGGWLDVTRRFNSRFEGRVLAGQITPRPARTFTQLKSRRTWLISKTAAVGRQEAKPRNRARKSAIRHTKVELPVEECD